MIYLSNLFGSDTPSSLFQKKQKLKHPRLHWEQYLCWDVSLLELQLLDLLWLPAESSLERLKDLVGHRNKGPI